MPHQLAIRDCGDFDLMLSLDLLRTRISRGKIEPLFCSLDAGRDSDYELANKLITQFENVHKTSKIKKSRILSEREGVVRT